MKKILVIGSTGQIGSELTKVLRETYGNENVVAGYIKGAEPKGWLAESGPMAEADVTNPQMIADIVKQYQIDTIYNLAALLSVVAESKPRLAWKIIKKNIEHKNQHNALPNGLICLKGGNLQAETQPFKKIVSLTEIHDMFKEEWFKEKYLIYLPL
jgi:putative NADH-flavin reductase